MAWTKKEVNLLGAYPDVEVAKRLKRSVSCIARKRERLGIPRFSSSKMTPANQALLGTMEDNELARKVGLSGFTISEWRRRLKIPPFAARNRRWTQKELKMLGKYHDSDVAKRLKRDVVLVRRKRLSLARSKPANPGRWTPAEIALLLKHNDLDVADRTGRRLRAVSLKRRQLHKDPLFRHLSGQVQHA